MDNSSGAKLVETAWHMWDYRKSVNNANETANSSIEVNKRIRNEDERGFENLTGAARKLARQSRAQ